MALMFDEETGAWTLDEEAEEELLAGGSHRSYAPSLLAFLNGFGPFFHGAQRAAEFHFLWTLLGIRGMQDEGWEPFEATLEAVDAVRSVWGAVDDRTGFHLGLWVYGHILEASEPYEILANLLGCIRGEGFNVQRFPARPNGSPVSPGEKIRRLKAEAEALGFGGALAPLENAWDRELRNSIFHADYSFGGGAIRLAPGRRSIDLEQILTFINAGLAYLESIRILRSTYLGLYKEPTLVPVPASFAHREGETAWVIVRERARARRVCVTLRGLSPGTSGASYETSAR